MKKKVALLGATGSIGKNTLDVLARNKIDFEVVLLSANNNSTGLAEAGTQWPGAVRVLCGVPGGKEKLLEAIAV